MGVPRIYYPHALRVGAELVLGADAHHHLAHVLRAKPAQAVIVFDGAGQECEATVVAVNKRNTVLQLVGCSMVNRESPLQITLAQCVSRGDRMDFALQKCVELGVQRIVPILAERTNLAHKATLIKKRHAHWQGVVNSAMEQSGRTQFVPVDAPVNYLEWLAQPLGETKLLLDPNSTETIASVEHTKRCTLLIGPEGGFSSSEITVAAAAGYQRISFGPRILRTETAAVAAVSVLQSLWGDLR
jgi:16S rRNA (uracil1498-N3)-methyltransferase